MSSSKSANLTGQKWSRAAAGFEEDDKLWVFDDMPREVQELILVQCFFVNIDMAATCHRIYAWLFDIKNTAIRGRLYRARAQLPRGLHTPVLPSIGPGGESFCRFFPLHVEPMEVAQTLGSLGRWREMRYYFERVERLIDEIKAGILPSVFWASYFQVAFEQEHGRRPEKKDFLGIAAMNNLDGVTMLNTAASCLSLQDFETVLGRCPPTNRNSRFFSPVVFALHFNPDKKVSGHLHKHTSMQSYRHFVIELRLGMSSQRLAGLIEKCGILQAPSQINKEVSILLKEVIDRGNVDEIRLVHDFFRTGSRYNVVSFCSGDIQEKVVRYGYGYQLDNQIAWLTEPEAILLSDYLLSCPKWPLWSGTSVRDAFLNGRVIESQIPSFERYLKTCAAFCLFYFGHAEKARRLVALMSSCGLSIEALSRFVRSVPTGTFLEFCHTLKIQEVYPDDNSYDLKPFYVLNEDGDLKSFETWFRCFGRKLSTPARLSLKRFVFQDFYSETVPWIIPSLTCDELDGTREMLRENRVDRIVTSTEACRWPYPI